MATGCIGATLLIAGCGGGSGATASASHGAASPPAPGPSGALTCSLPVAQPGVGPVLAGFISLPAGTFKLDPTGQIEYAPGDNRSRTVQAPVLYGDGGATYDRARGRWLPVIRSQVLPNGSAYVYTREGHPTQVRNEIHLVDVASGTDRVIYDQGAYDALAFTPEGVYLTFHLNGTDAASGLWLLDPQTQALKAYPSGRRASWDQIAGGGAWSYSLEGSRFGSNTFARMDLSTGAIATWFTVASPAPPGESGARSIHILGFDDQLHPLVEVYSMDGSSEAWKLTAAGQAIRLTGLNVGMFTPHGSLTDARGTWVAGADGVYLLNGSSFQRVAPAPPGWTADYTIAGPCA